MSQRPPTEAPNTDLTVPALTVALTPDAAIARLDAMAKRGRLAGFVRTPGGFAVDAFGEEFNATLFGDVTADGTGAQIRWRVRLRRMAPIIWTVVFAAAIFPGVLLTDSFLLGLGWYAAMADATGLSQPWFTVAWYVPLSVIPLPWYVPGLIKKNRAAMAASASEAAAKIAAELGAGERAV